MFTGFEAVSDRFGKTRTPNGLSDDWLSPYRLLWGAAYSIGRAKRSTTGMSDGAGADIPQDLSSSLKEIVKATDEHPFPWFHFWNTSYMLTNAIYRIAAASEKSCCLAAQHPEGDRQWLWEAVKEADSALSKKIPKAHELLGEMPTRKNRATFLQAQREGFPADLKVTLPLVCAFIQTDIDKHVAYKPLKQLAFDFTLATQSFLEACDLWDAAVVAARADEVIQ